MVFACKKDNNNGPGIDALVAQLEANKTNCICEPVLYEKRWKSAPIYIYTCRGPACNCVSVYYNSRGGLIELSDKEKSEVALSSFQEIKWICEP